MATNNIPVKASVPQRGHASKPISVSGRGSCFKITAAEARSLIADLTACLALLDGSGTPDPRGPTREPGGGS